MTKQATYHGLTKIECRGCGYTTTDTTTMELWNDLGVDCPKCGSAPTFDVVFYNADGRITQVSGDLDDPTYTELGA